MTIHEGCPMDIYARWVPNSTDRMQIDALWDHGTLPIAKVYYADLREYVLHLHNRFRDLEEGGLNRPIYGDETDARDSRTIYRCIDNLHAAVSAMNEPDGGRLLEFLTETLARLRALVSERSGVAIGGGSL